jgi:hypothetical protein
LTLAAVATSDARRRLSEDLGVALAALFMVQGFDVLWGTIAQIPANARLSKKRPDFEAFDSAGVRFLFEAKGTTGLGNVEKALHKALSQVKAYPEQAARKLAIVSYFAADERLFPSYTLVVDPPALPDTVAPTDDVARLLHGQKLFEFAGLPQTADAYLRTLSKHLRAEGGQISRFAPRDPELWRVYQAEVKRPDILQFERDGTSYLGHRADASGIANALVFGVAKSRLERLLLMTPTEELEVKESGGSDVSSLFDDGSIVLIKQRS